MNDDGEVESESKPKATELSPEELAELEPTDWPKFDRDDLDDLDFSLVPDSALPTDKRCPLCEWPVFLVVSMGPHRHQLSPCGCRVGMLDF